MKIIDLLNKIANGEELPKKVKYDNLVYEYNEQYDYKNELQINYYSVDNGTDFFNNVFCYSLNDEVEILGEEKKIPKKLGLCAYEDGGISYSWSISEASLKTKINEIIDYLKSKGE